MSRTQRSLSQVARKTLDELRAIKNIGEHNPFTGLSWIWRYHTCKT